MRCGQRNGLGRALGTWAVMIALVVGATALGGTPPISAQGHDDGVVVDIVVDKYTLLQTIERASILHERSYSATSWAALQARLRDAREVYEDPTATQAEVDEARDALWRVFNGLQAPEFGYTYTTARGEVWAFGASRHYGSLAGVGLSQPIVAIESTLSGEGYWLVASDGGVFSFGDARFYGSTGAIRLNQPIVGMAGTPSGNGYWLVTSDGGRLQFW